MTEIELRGEKVALLPERAIYLPRTKTMLVADLHWGKAEVFQMRGVAIPSSVQDDDLARLSRALRSHETEHLVVLGDLTHSKKAVTIDVVDRVQAWRLQHSDTRMTLVRGNHDRGLVLPENWNIEMQEESWQNPPFVFTHEPDEEASELFTFAGHLHPTITLRGRADSLRLPCFAVSNDFAVLPAFSFFTGGHDIKRRDWKYVYAIADDRVVAV